VVPIDGITLIVSPTCQDHAPLLSLLINVLQMPRGPIGVLLELPLVSANLYGPCRTNGFTPSATYTIDILCHHLIAHRKVKGGVKRTLLDAGLTHNALIVIPLHHKVRKHKNRIVKHTLSTPSKTTQPPRQKSEDIAYMKKPHSLSRKAQEYKTVLHVNMRQTPGLSTLSFREREFLSPPPLGGGLGWGFFLPLEGEGRWGCNPEGCPVNIFRVS